jgi:hypothetical protein
MVVRGASEWGCQALLGPLQEGNPADGQGKRSDPRAETRHIPLRERAGPERSAAVRAGSRRSGKGEPRFSGLRRSSKPYTVRYEALNAMLLNEFLKEHRKNEEQESKIEQQEAKIARQQKQIDALTAGLQKVSAQIEASKPAPQIVRNNQ